MKMHDKSTREPLLRVVKRDSMPIWKSMLIRVIAVLAAILVCGVLSVLVLDNVDFIKFIKTLFSGAVGTSRNIWKLGKNTAVLLCISLAVTPAFRMKFWNIGAEGQTLIGALAAVAVAYYLGGKLPNPVLLGLMLIAAVLAGAIWGGLPAIFKAKWNTNETLFTLMMNYVATGLVAFCLAKWCPSNGSVLGALPFGHLPVILNEYLLLIIVTLVLTAIVYVYLYYTKHGYEISVVGESENTARYIGINVGKVVVRTMIVSGAICGLAGFLIVGALDHSITTTSVGGMGFTAIMVSWLAKFNPLVMLLTAGLVSLLN
ncbi:MAG: ABC transporter permease, partial [Clostridia bacterium]|nr:ABC transporter permease [Clostridia bacterium]